MINGRHKGLALAAGALLLVALPAGQVPAAEAIRFSPIAPATATASGWLAGGVYSLPPGIGALTLTVSAAGSTVADVEGAPVDALAVGLAIANNGNQSLVLDSSTARLTDTGGQLLVGAALYSGPIRASTVTIGPGGKADLQLVFYLPASLKLDTMAAAGINLPYTYGRATYAADLQFTRAEPAAGYAEPGAGLIDSYTNLPDGRRAGEEGVQPYEGLLSASLPYYNACWGYYPGSERWWLWPRVIWWGSGYGGLGFDNFGPLFIVGQDRHELRELLAHHRGLREALGERLGRGGDPPARAVTAPRSALTWADARVQDPAPNATRVATAGAAPRWIPIPGVRADATAPGAGPRWTPIPGVRPDPTAPPIGQPRLQVLLGEGPGGAVPRVERPGIEGLHGLGATVASPRVVVPRFEIRLSPPSLRFERSPVFVPRVSAPRMEPAPRPRIERPPVFTPREVAPRMEPAPRPRIERPPAFTPREAAPRFEAPRAPVPRIEPPAHAAPPQTSAAPPPAAHRPGHGGGRGR